MKFAVATNSRFEKYKVKSDKFRTTPSGKKVITLKKLDKIDKLAKKDVNIKIYEHTDPEFKRILNE